LDDERILTVVITLQDHIRLLNGTAFWQSQGRGELYHPLSQFRQRTPAQKYDDRNNHLSLEHRPSAWKLTFDDRGALSRVKGGEDGEGDGGIKVGYADAWLKSR
jgi:hypothetical protein